MAKKEVRTEVHKTKVAVDLAVLKQVEQEMLNEWRARGGSRVGPERSYFLSWNRVSKFLNEIDNGKERVEVVMTGSCSDQSTRIYYTPSVTSLPRVARKAIVPINKENKFIYLDLRNAEFALMAHFAGMKGVLAEYEKGANIYDLFKKEFPEGTPYLAYKTVLVGNLYGMSAFTASKRIGCSEVQAERLLNRVKCITPEIESLKARIVDSSQQLSNLNGNHYIYPLNQEQTEFGEVIEQGEWNACKAWSVYGQSGLGVMMQRLMKRFAGDSRFQEGDTYRRTCLSVFDSVLVEASENEEQEFIEIIHDSLYPLLGDAKIGTTFFNAAQ